MSVMLLHVQYEAFEISISEVPQDSHLDLHFSKFRVLQVARLQVRPSQERFYHFSLNFLVVKQVRPILYIRYMIKRDNTVYGT